MALLGSGALATATGVAVQDTVRFAAAVGWSILLPGVLLLRLLLPRRRALPQEFATGFVVGLGAQLLAWGSFVATGVGGWLILYPLPLLAAVALVPRLRARLRGPAYAERMPTGAAWALCAAYLLALLRLWATVLRHTPLPPSTGRWYPDLYWHLSISAEAMHHAPPQVPQVSGQPLLYHWFANAQMAADALVARVDVLEVAARLWYLPVYAATLLLTYLLTARLARSPRAGLLAVALLVVPSALTPVTWVPALATDALLPLSPSQVFGLPVLLALLGSSVHLVRAPGMRAVPVGEWVLLALFAALAAGAKSSILPTVLVAALLTGAIRWWRERAVHGPTLMLAAVLLVVLLPASRFLAGGSAGSTPGLLTGADELTALKRAIAQHHAHPHVVTGLDLRVLAVLLSALVLIQFSGVLLAWPLRRDPGAVLLAASCAAGFAGLMLVHHPGGSQLYFMRGVLPLVAVLTSWGATHVLRRTAPGAVSIALSAVAGLAAWALVAVVAAVAGRHRGAHVGILPLAIALLVLAAGALACVLVVRRSARRLGVAAVALLAAILVPSTVDAARAGAADSTSPASSARLSAAEIAGTTWLRTHTPARDVVATDVHCLSGPTRTACDARAFWVTGLGERQAYVESWGYTDQAAAAASNHPARHLNYTHTAFFDPARLRRNDSAFTAPTPALLARLYADGVRVLFADTSAGPVSASLRTLARPVFRDGTVSIYLLRPAR
ncbi:hypothetical protein [Allobranchiibius sp. GilTou38]|uniref:hypothetical protein n=1 Tax=Allobranchiibius sp. GilTou38 TaxID=2815210 RepID=UPI001AA1C1EA|nr:hypothetical protein [Allobranchiibius sp. GilTou38]MBO1765713.1 hypothetical protein [Allobranchiibius sp. GilTou38]